MTLDILIMQVFSGFSLFSVLVLMALGLTIVFGLMGVINMAHGELMALGAYMTYVTSLVFQQMNGKGYKRKEHEHRTPSSNRRSGAPKKNFESSRQAFRQPDFQYQNQRDEKTQSTPATGRGRGGGRGGSRGRGSPSPRGRGQPFRGGSPPRR